MATTGICDDNPLLFLNDCTSDQCYFIDFDAAVSALSATTSDHREKKKGSPFQVANRTQKPTYRTKTLLLYLGIDHKFTWTFIVKDVSKPILGADFLYYSDLLIDLARKCFINGQTFSSTSFHISHDQAIAFCYLVKPSIYHSLLQSFFPLTKPCLNRSNIQHNVAQHIVTNGSPVFAPFRRLSPEKLQVGQKEFNKMLALGIIHSSKYNWSSPLHIFPKTHGRG